MFQECLVLFFSFNSISSPVPYLLLLFDLGRTQWPELNKSLSIPEMSNRFVSSTGLNVIEWSHTALVSTRNFKMKIYVNYKTNEEDRRKNSFTAFSL